MRQNYLYRGVRGMKDVFPEEARRYQLLEQRARDFFARYGCGEIRTPLVEHTLLFERGVGQGTDIVNKEMFYVPAKDEEGGPDAMRRMVLRPEATASVARAYIEHEIDKTSPGLQRYFYMGSMFRYERPQKGRFRQFTQIGVEFIGSASPAVDAEAIILLHDYLESFSPGTLTLLLNSVGCPVCRPGYVRQLAGYARGREAELCEDCRTRLEKNTLRLFDCKQAACREVMAAAPNIQDSLCPDCRNHQHELQDTLENAKIPARVEWRLMRGLDYYTRTVFEIVSDQLGAQNTVAAGGRYDHLVSDLAGPETPAVGWSLGVERFLELLPELPSEPAYDLYVVDPGVDLKAALGRVTQLRRQGLRVGLEPERRSVKALMKRADKVGARFVLFAVSEEPGKIELKDMTTGEQVRLAWENIAGHIQSKPV